MGNILEFPSQQAQALAWLERQIRSLLLSKGADEQLIEFASDSLTRVYSRLLESNDYSFTVTLPEGLKADERAQLEQQINGALERLQKENRALILDLVAQLVLAEVRLFQQQRL